ncbi:NAD(P)-dependent oxidoreductase [Natrinema versiforme]|uniref:NAD-dependent epimerase/dehydratase n=1 Tax=Natrinema versiforme JCM 10478 TaxID=1227496 RepID=L9XNW5_9EURY|nr:hypothetical protein [Natrinema versiforme]ELY63091.1 NAD-dependent epimerase/dehydratase [Natrinema versiforme JCM 10478]
MIEPGERTGEYRTAAGNSSQTRRDSDITIDDFAIAFANGLEEATAVDTSFGTGY